MNRRARLIFLGISLGILIAVGRFVTGDFSFLAGQFWFAAGALLLILLSLIDQPHFSKDSNIFVNAITAGVSLLLVPIEDRDWVYWIFAAVTFYLTVSSYALMWLRTNALRDETRWIQLLSRVNRKIGRPQTLFSGFFLWGALRYFGPDSNGFKALLLYWVIFMIIDVEAIAKSLGALFGTGKGRGNENALGQIFGVQSRSTFLVRLFPERNAKVKLFDVVEFVHSIDGDNKMRKGLVLDSYVLNEQQWVKVLTTPEIKKDMGEERSLGTYSEGIVYRAADVPENQFLNTFVGLVTENSSIQRIRFVYSSLAAVQEGQLLELRIGSNRHPVYYQIVEGIAKIEPLENKNETGLIVGEAIQLGTWNHQAAKFESFGWVPEINTPVYTASRIEEAIFAEPDLTIGYIPGSNFPVVINKVLALTHHTAVLGVTGTGKSVFSRNLIREYLKDHSVKAVCVDFTGEYGGKFADLKPSKVVAPDKEFALYEKFEWVSNELEKFGNQQDKGALKAADEFIRTTFRESLESFLRADESRISIIELPDVSNTTGILEYTRQLFKSLFAIAKSEKCFGRKVCIVLEEAHTVIPEWNFVGVSDRSSQSLLNSIAQVALQGRKYDVGLLVIAQRTANVSKSVLTQCNTIISFQQFDNTSSEFLCNYFGQDMAKVLPNLRFRQAIVAGKALRSNVPMIVEIPEINEIGAMPNELGAQADS